MTKELRMNEMITYGKIASDSGLIYGNFGNLSIKHKDKIYITKSGAMLGKLTRNDIVTFSDEIPREASSDSPIHLELYKTYNCNTILHMHGNYTILTSLNHKNIIPYDFVGMRFLEKILVVEGEFGTSSLTNAIVQNLRNDVVVVRGHGSFAIGKDLRTAYILSCALEISCEIIHLKEIYDGVITKKEVKK